MNRTQRKPGLNDSRIAQAKRIALMATYGAHREGKAAVMVLSYGARPTTDLQRSLDARYHQPGLNQGAQLFTESGSFEHLSGRGI